eukprot:CAMPEP_0113962444 /NCGR_PEP_ID=MMETSP0011_2-20120614/5921_1 /TAXON_ID=101924 /ORGANISM="Rhodosorus marinus" /LENGTH=545 /DNA_ID=CAMNT_0000974303 /DNA_START=749 /DNA_END=2386 /DNA_ORIENTATION=+ /assembly_acc=CAM_ASM_000156
MSAGRVKAQVEILEDLYVDDEGETRIEDVGLGAELADVVRSMGVETWFPMQAEVISLVLKLERSVLQGDIIISSPTGSGKTLAYAVPVVECLRARSLKRIRALVITPTRDLASQVKSVFDTLGEPFGLTTFLAVGQGGSMAAEAEALRDNSPDILVATPGRIVHHITSSPGFSLVNLRFLVIDESDRLLQQHYNNWVDVLFKEVKRCQSTPGKILREQGGEIVGSKEGVCSPRCPVRRILASATQTRNPKRLAVLHLQCIRRIIATEHKTPRKKVKFSMPASLHESAIIVPSKRWKLAGLLNLLRPWDDSSFGAANSSIVFTKSVESSHKLTRLLQLAVVSSRSSLAVLEFSAGLSSDRRRQVVKSLSRKDKRLVVVCSDAMSRGIDAAQVDTVINYDIPVHVKTYLHRVGRTARGGKEGSTITILAPEQEDHFNETTRKASRGSKSVDIREVSPVELEASNSVAEPALAALQILLRREDLGLIKIEAPLDERLGVELMKEVNAGSNFSYESETNKGPSNKTDLSSLIRAQIAKNFREGTGTNTG